MNGEALPIVHGYPLRVIVPGWYAVASVKWLTQIEMISDRFSGHYQTEAYFYEWQRGGQLIREPVSLQRVRSLITEPEPESEVEQDELPISRCRLVRCRTYCPSRSQHWRWSLAKRSLNGRTEAT
jgi:DMSO/TMAO reductase YedYZ molybdopterin-dependent catalytic subunit